MYRFIALVMLAAGSGALGQCGSLGGNFEAHTITFNTNWSISRLLAGPVLIGPTYLGVKDYAAVTVKTAGNWCGCQAPPVGTDNLTIAFSEPAVPANGVSWNSGLIGPDPAAPIFARFLGDVYQESASILGDYYVHSWQTHQRACPQQENEYVGKIRSSVREIVDYPCDEMSNIDDRYVISLNPVTLLVESKYEVANSGVYSGCEEYPAAARAVPMKHRLFVRLHFLYGNIFVFPPVVVFGFQGSMELVDGNIQNRRGSLFRQTSVVNADTSGPPEQCPGATPNTVNREYLLLSTMDSRLIPPFFAPGYNEKFSITAIRQINIFYGDETDGDADYSGTVDVLDRRLVIQLDGADIDNDPQGRYEPRADLDWSGVVDASDLVEFDAQYCTADLSGNGFVDSADFVLFGNYYSAGSMHADFDGNSVLNVLDYIEFMNVAAGCP